MPGYTFRVPRVPLARETVPIAAFKYAPPASYEPLPLVRVVEVSFREGPEPSKAVFEYVGGDYRSDMVPWGFERALPLRRVGTPGVLLPDDRIVVAALTPTGALRFLFHGYVQVPETNFSERDQTISFQAQGIEYRCWDDILRVCRMRDASDISTTFKNTDTGLPIRFNPKVGNRQIGNMVAEGLEAETDAGRKYAVFLDTLSVGRQVDSAGGGMVSAGQYWNLFHAVNHILTIATDGNDLIKIQDYEYLKILLSVILPRWGDYFDPDNADTWDLRPIVIPDTDVTLDPWPDAIAKLLRPNGYAMAFRLGSDGVKPITYLDIYKTNESAWARYKDLYLQSWQDVLEPGASNVQSARMALDISNIVNAVSVDTSPVRVEAGFILAPMFVVDANDLTAANKVKFDTNYPDFKTYRDRYRLFGFDETGEGHQALTIAGPDSRGFRTMTSLTWVTTAGDLTPIFGVDADDVPEFVPRRRPPYTTLWSKDVLGEHLRAELYLSVDYAGPAPAMWDGIAGTWFRVQGGYELLDDRLGIRVTNSKVNAWSIGKPAAGMPSKQPAVAGEIRLLEWFASATATARLAMTLMLVCVIESDQHLKVTADRRAVSPTKFTVRRGIDQRSRLRPGIIHPSSYHHPNRGQASAAPQVVGSELETAQDYARGKRESRQLGRWAGQVTIPRLVNSYQVGDRLRRIVGRDATMQVNLDGGGREAPVYPRVIGITWSFQKGQKTQLVLTDKRSDHAEPG